MLIAIAGPKGSGKTTLANILKEEYGFQIESFATPMKKCLQDLFKFEDDQLYTLAGKEEIDERYGVSPRTIMQNFGTEFVRSTVPTLWLQLMRTVIHKGPENIIIDDCRFEDEADLVRELGGVVIHLYGRKDGHCVPCTTVVSTDSSHASEKSLSIRPGDQTICNDDSNDMSSRDNLLSQLSFVKTFAVISNYRDKGWIFTYSDNTKYVEAIHHEGGRQSICELKGPLFHREAFGNFIRDCLTNK